jgi:hypothetical protein
LIGLSAMIVTAVAALTYLFADFLWWLPLPLYIEFYSLPLVMIGAVAGYAGFWKALPFTRLPASSQLRPALHICCVLVVPAALIFGATKLPVISEPFVDQALVSHRFEPDLSISAGSRWKGSVYTVFGSYREQLAHYTLWLNRIPTHNVVSQTATPLWYYMTFKVMHTRDPRNPPHPSLSIPLGQWDIGLSAAFGIRYIMLPAEANVADGSSDGFQDSGDIQYRYLSEYGIDRKIPLKEVAPADGRGGFSWLIYELPDPNYGQYSPNVVQLATEAAEYRHIFSASGFDWRRNVALEKSPGPLTRASDASLYIERGHLRVEARSESGRSLILLPVQYSRRSTARAGQHVFCRHALLGRKQGAN